MTIAMNTTIREAVFLELRRRKMTQKDLSERTGISNSYISRLLNGDVEGGREAWESIFNELGLELTVVPKGQGG